MATSNMWLPNDRMIKLEIPGSVMKAPRKLGLVVGHHSSTQYPEMCLVSQLVNSLIWWVIETSRPGIQLTPPSLAQISPNQTLKGFIAQKYMWLGSHAAKNGLRFELACFSFMLQ